MKMKTLFGLDFEREGRGVPEDGSKSPAWIRFFEIIYRKFWAMLRVNFMQTIGNLPALLISAFFLSYFYLSLVPEQAGMDFTFRVTAGFIMVSLQLVAVGPVQAGFIFAMRNYAREENVFVWSDFIRAARENWKLATAVSLIDLAVMVLISYTFRFYQTFDAGLGMMTTVCLLMLVCGLVLYSMMHLFLYPMMVTLELSLKQLYSNAFRFAIGLFLPNAGILVLMVAFDCLLFLNPVIGIIGMFFLGFSFPNFLSTFYAYQGIEKYIIKKVNTKDETT